MKLQLNCGACMINQALLATKTHEITPQRQVEIIRSLVQDIPCYLDQPTPSHFQSILLHKLAESLQVSDIYAADKLAQNQLAAQLIAPAREALQRSQTPLYTAALLAVEGNSIDQLFFTGHEIENKIGEILNHHFAIDDFSLFEARLAGSASITYVNDNAGEVFFDKLFVEVIQNWRESHHLAPAEVTFIVKGGPILNDATLEDATLAGLEECGSVITSESNYLGCAPDQIGAEAKQALSKADLIISKGQANLETLEGIEAYQNRIFFFLKAKCLHVSAFLGAAEGSSVLYHPS